MFSMYGPKNKNVYVLFQIGLLPEGSFYMNISEVFKITMA